MGMRSRGSKCIRVVLALAVLVGTTGIAGLASAAVLRPPMDAVSVDSDEVFSSSSSYGVGVNDTGQYVVFFTSASMVVEDDDGGYQDIYRRDRVTGETTLVSSPAATTTNPWSHAYASCISDDGNRVLFYTGMDLVPEDVNGAYDFYVKDVTAGTYEWVDFWGNGSGVSDYSDVAFSGDGSTVVISTYNTFDGGDVNSGKDIYAYDLDTDTVTWVSAPTAETSDVSRGSRDCDVSDDGSYIAFFTGKDLDAADTNGDQDIYLYDMQSDVYTVCDLRGDGSAAGDEVWDVAISGDASTIVFYSDYAFVTEDVGHQADVYRFVPTTGVTTWLTQFSSWTNEWDRGARTPAVSDDGRWVGCFTGKDLAPEDENGSGRDLYLIDGDSLLQYQVDAYGDGSPLDSSTGEICLSGDGTTMVFLTPDGLAVGDSNGSQDVYAFVNPFDPQVDYYTAQRNITLSVPVASGVLVNDLARSGQPLEITGPSTAAHGTVDIQTDGSFTYTPDAGYQGSDSFVYYFTDGSSSGAGLAVIDVVNAVPVAAGDSYSMQQDGYLYVAAAGLLANDSDANGDPLNSIKVSNPANGTVTIAPDGSFTYLPSAGFVGVDSFTYKANDGQVDSAAATVSITVNAGGSGPVSEMGGVFRFYNRLTGTHFYTYSVAERDSVLQNLRGTLIYEGVAFYVNPASDTVPLYRFYNRLTNSHFYTASAEEKSRVQATLSSIFTYEGVAFNVSTEAGPGKVAVYRFFNVRRGSHFYTSSAAERDNVIAKWPTIYRYEGVAFYVTP